MRILIASLFGMVLFFPGAVRAESINAAGAESLRASLQKNLDEMVKTSGKGNQITASGPVVVLVGADQYNVTLPAMVVSGKQGLGLDMGEVKLGIAPDAPGRWRVGVRLPSSLRLVDEAGKPVAGIAIGSQQIGGLWVEKLENFVQQSIDVRNVTIAMLGEASEPGMPVKASIAGISGVKDLRQDARGLWSGQSGGTVSGVVAVDVSGREVGRIASVSGTSTWDRADLAKAASLIRKFRDMAEANPAALEGSAIPQPVADLLKNLVGLAEGGASQIEVKGVAFSDPQTGKGMSLAEMAFGIAGTHLSGPLSGVRLTYSHSGLSMTPPMPEPDLVPHALSFSLVAEKLPLKELVSQGLDGVMAAQRLEDQEKGRAMMEKIGDKLRALMVSAKTAFNLKAVLLTASAEGKISGNALVSKTSPSVFSGSATARFSGLDELIIEAAKAAAAARPEEENPVMSMLPFLTMVQAMAQAERGADGRNEYSLKFDLGEDGILMLNGQPMGGAATPEEARPAPAPKRNRKR